MKKILIPIDFKFNSYDAIDYAVAFFKSEKCHFYFLNTYTYDVDGLNAINLLQADDDWFEEPKQNSEIRLERAIRKYTFNNRNENHWFNAISECTNLVEGIKKTIKDLKIDLLLFAGKGQTNIEAKIYSKNTKRIIDNIRECPVMIIPASAHIKNNPKFIFVSNFEINLPNREIENWYELVKITKGSVKIISLSRKDKLTTFQIANQNKVRLQIEKLFEIPVSIEYLETPLDLRNFSQYNSDHIISWMERKPDFWRRFGLTHSRITSLGPLPSNPLIALHR